MGKVNQFMQLCRGLVTLRQQFLGVKIRLAVMRLPRKKFLACIPLLLSSGMVMATGWQYSSMPGCYPTRDALLSQGYIINNPDTTSSPPTVYTRDSYSDNGDTVTWHAHLVNANGTVANFSYDVPGPAVCDRIENTSKSMGKPQNCGCGGVPTVGDPINAADGNMYDAALDYLGLGTFPLRAERYYNSLPGDLAGWGSGWRGFYNRKIFAVSNGTAASVMRADGKSYYFTLNNNVWTTDSDITDRLTKTGTGWTYLNASNETESYDVAGKLVSITSLTGLTHTLAYSCGPSISATCPVPTPTSIAPIANLLITVSDQFGHQLNFTYDAYQRVVGMTDPAGSTYVYAYSGTAYSDNLVSVTYPDSKVRTYLYGEPAYTSGASLPHNMTGILDENNQRYTTWNYDATGRAISSEHAVGIEKTSLNFGSDTATVVIDPLGSSLTYQLQTVLGVIKSSGVTRQPGGATTAMTYDTNGNVATRTDFNENVTTYTYDLTKNLEISRTEASGTAQARTITTQWHPTYRLPAVIVEPLRKTIFNYDPSGNLLNKTVQATTDVNGSQGFSAQTTGTPRTWSYTYNQYGQMLTATGPRTDVVDKTTYSYDPVTGNLLTITNAAQQVTALSNYDLNGQVGTITDPNGLTTNLTYYPRGWLKSKTVSSGGTTQTTNYIYDGVGQLTSVTLPDNSTINYTYDAAHRLTDISDSLGNTIHYTLDAMGNRLSEQVKDPQATLTRQTTRVFDALNRLQQVTGAGQ